MSERWDPTNRPNRGTYGWARECLMRGYFVTQQYITYRSIEDFDANADPSSRKSWWVQANGPHRPPHDEQPLGDPDE